MNAPQRPDQAGDDPTPRPSPRPAASTGATDVPAAPAPAPAPVTPAASVTPDIPVAAGAATVPGPAGDDPPRPAEGSGRRRLSFWMELPILLAAAIVLAIVIKTFLVQAFFIPSSSMERTLHGCPGCSGDRVLVNKLVYDFRDPHRGDIVVFRGTGSWAETTEFQVSKPSNPASRFFRWASSSLGLGASGEKDYIKRVVAVGGDTVGCCDSQGRVTVNGYPLNEPYIYEPAQINGQTCTARQFGPITVPRGRLWVMGDHRSASDDSRCKIQDGELGTVSNKDVIGKAFITIWPPSRWRTLGTPPTFHHVPSPGQADALQPAALQPAALQPAALPPAAPTGPDPVTLAGLLLTPVLYRKRRARRAARGGTGPPAVSGGTIV